jgi:hypothetical protein
LIVDSKLDAARRRVAPIEADAGDIAGLLLGRLTVLPALLVLPFLLTSFPLLLIGWFKPVPVILLWLALTAAIVPYIWRRIPSVTGSADFGTDGAGRAKPTPRWVLWTLLAIAIAFGAFQAVYHSQFIIVQLDAASYMEFASWISKHGSVPIPQNAAAFGHSTGITFASAAFYQVGNSIVPQFMAGLPMLLSTGFWAGGARLAVFWAPVLGALGLFTFGGLVARLVGPRWAPLGMLVMGIGIPEAYTSRNTYSETLAQILFLGALSLWIDVQRADRGAEDAGRWRTSWRSHLRSPSHVLAAVTGLLFGIMLLVRIDGPADILPVVPFCGLLVLRRQRQVIPLVAGILVGLVYGAVDAAFLTLPYLKVNGSSVKYMAAAFAVVTVATVAVVWWQRRRGTELPFPVGLKKRLVQAVTVAPFIVLVAFIVRPYVERNWHALQYAPLSLHWIYWYTGATAIGFAVIATAMIGRRCIKGEAPLWVLPLMTFAWAIVWFLLRPAITAHQPYASRRLVADVLPGIILLAVWLTAWITRKSRVVRMVDVPAYLERSPRWLITGVCAAALFVPPLIGNFGLGIKAGGLATQRAYVGEIAAIEKICQSLPADASVLIADYTMNQQFAQDIRGTCGVPVAGLGSTQYPGIETIPPNAAQVSGDGVSPQTVLADVQAIKRIGRRPIVLAPATTPLAQLGNGSIKLIMAQDTSIDEHVVFGTPMSTLPQRMTVYSWEPAQ